MLQRNRITTSLCTVTKWGAVIDKSMKIHHISSAKSFCEPHLYRNTSRSWQALKSRYSLVCLIHTLSLIERIASVFKLSCEQDLFWQVLVAMRSTMGVCSCLSIRIRSQKWLSFTTKLSDWDCLSWCLDGDWLKVGVARRWVIDDHSSSLR